MCASKFRKGLFLSFLSLSIIFFVVKAAHSQDINDHNYYNLRCTLLGDVKESGAAPRKAKSELKDQAKKIDQRKVFVFNELIERYDYYACASQWYQAAWVTITMAVLLISAATAMAAAFDVGAKPYGKYILAGLASTTALLASILSQYHLRDTWQQRESARIDIQILQDRVRQIDEADTEALDKLSKVHLDAINIEKNQADHFFSNLPETAPPKKPNP